MSDTRLSPGDPAPDFTLTSDTGDEVSLSDLRGRKVIVYFYPAAMTPGCTKQACDFTDSLDSLKGAGYEVLGISPDKPEKLAKFRERDGLTITLLSDPDKDGARGVRRVRREEALRQDRPGRDPLDVRRRRAGRGRARAVQREGHRPRRQAPARPRPRRLGRALHSPLRARSPTAEAVGLGPAQCEFESHRAHHPADPALVVAVRQPQRRVARFWQPRAPGQRPKVSARVAPSHWR